jgi:hypothetical protein
MLQRYNSGMSVGVNDDARWILAASIDLDCDFPSCFNPATSIWFSLQTQRLKDIKRNY